ncbi:hypothetical protein EVC12_003 [Rhizobium phage RHph_I42]|nr:hypothetical protein EVC12_003 [Rhizobium phage RHph_I42]
MTLAQLEAIKAVLAKTHGNSAFTAQSILLLQVMENCVDAAIAVAEREDGKKFTPHTIFMSLVEYMNASHPKVKVTMETDLVAHLNEGERNDLLDELIFAFDLDGEAPNYNSFGDDAKLVVGPLVTTMAHDANLAHGYAEADDEDDDDDTDEESPTIDDVEEDMESVLFERYEDYDDDDEFAAEIKADLSAHLTKAELEELVVDTREVIAHTDAEIEVIRLIAPRIVFASFVANKAKSKKIVPIARLARNLHAAIHGEFNFDAEQEAAFVEWMKP